MIDEANVVFVEYGIKMCESKSKVVCMKREVKQRVWKFGEGLLEETDKYKCLGVVEEGGIKVCSLGERMNYARGVIGMLKYAAKKIRK